MIAFFFLNKFKLYAGYHKVISIFWFLDFYVSILEILYDKKFLLTYSDFYINNHLFLAWLVTENSAPQVVSFIFFTSVSPHNLARVVHGNYNFPTIHDSKNDEITISKNLSFTIFQMQFHS